MKSLRDVSKEISQQLLVDKWWFYAGKQWRQNIEVDEKDYTVNSGIILLDPINQVSDNVSKLVDVWTTQLTIGFFYKQPTGNDVTQEDVDKLIDRAKLSAKEFFLRLQQYRDPNILIRNIGAKQILELDTFLDLCLCGVRVICPVTYNDPTSICLPQPPLV